MYEFDISREPKLLCTSHILFLDYLFKADYLRWSRDTVAIAEVPAAEEARRSLELEGVQAGVRMRRRSLGVGVDGRKVVARMRLWQSLKCRRRRRL